MHYNSAILPQFSKKPFSIMLPTKIIVSQLKDNSDLFRTFATDKVFL